MAETPAIVALRVPVRGVGAFNGTRSGEESDRGTHRENVPWVGGNDDGGASLAFPGLCVGVEISGGEDANDLGVEDQLRKTREEFLRVFGEEGYWEGVDSKRCLVGNEAKGQPGGLAHRERFVELAGKGVKIWRKSRGGGGRVGDKTGDRPAVIDLGGDCDGKDTVRIP